MRILKTAVAVVALAMLPYQASAATIIITNATHGLYNSGLGELAAMDGPGGFLRANGEGDPTIVLPGDPNFVFTAEFGANWLAGNYGGGTWTPGPVAIPASWPILQETAIVYDFNLAAPSSMHIDLGVDNGIVVWLDGTFLFGATAPGGSNLNEYNVDVASVVAGLHRLQILRADHGGSTDFDISVSVEAQGAPQVPEPSTLLLTTLSLAGARMMRRKKATDR